MSAVLVLGCGYTGERVARRLLDRGERVLATARAPAALERVARRGARVVALELSRPGAIAELGALVAGEHGLRVLCTIPPSADLPPASVSGLLRALRSPPARVVYLSSTSVHGEAAEVDEHTPAAPRDGAGRARLEAERAIAGGPWSTLVLRAAAIYGPHRGVHALLRRGRLGRVRDLDRVVSRVHVEDLAALSEAALASPVIGTFPVADDEPASTRDVADHCRALGLPALPREHDVGGTKAAGARAAGARGRRVDGRRIRALLGVALRHPSFRTGIAAALEQEALDEEFPGAPRAT